MESLFSSIVKLRHPLSAALGAGVCLAATIALLPTEEWSAGEWTAYGLSSAAIGIGIGGLLANLLEWIWSAARTQRLRSAEVRKAKAIEKRMGRLPTETKIRIGEIVAGQHKEHTALLVFDAAEAFHAERLVRSGLAKRHPGGRYELHPFAWAYLTAHADLFGLRRASRSGRYHGDPRIHYFEKND